MSHEQLRQDGSTAELEVVFERTRYKIRDGQVYAWRQIMGANQAGNGSGLFDWVAVAAPVAAAVTAVAREALRQHGETKREELRQNGETTRTALTGKLPDARAIEPVTDDDSEQ
ncbi:hypothetical protein [Actinoplanes sp. NPDC020271]|uniref:hypothetical protein n=1 Tax=Actinoplanes sp. NPDC020271 TaxID=3363896 RepID=UPI00378A2F58